jgi:hypothetical protein
VLRTVGDIIPPEKYKLNFLKEVSPEMQLVKILLLSEFETKCIGLRLLSQCNAAPV